MLGRNAARPLGMIPARLVTAYSSVAAHRLAHWMMSRPFAMATMQRYLSIAPQYLLTPASGSSTTSSQGISTPTLVALDGSATNSTQSSCQLHTSTTATATAAALLQHQSPPPLLAHDILLPADLFGTSTLSSSASSSSSDTTASEVIPQTVATPTPTSHNAIAYNYLLAASWHPKSRQRQQQQQQVQQVQKAQADAEAANTARTLLWKEKLKAAHPHPGKVDAGEDAFFHVSTRSRVALGVADGVGGWSELGVDPALFSWALMNNAENIARLTDCVPPEIDPPTAGGERSILDAQTILDGAYNELVQSGTVEAGSSTACILSLCKSTGTLRASNLGDSAFLLIRDNKCIYESPSQQHFWNCPYQLTVLPKDRQQQQQQQQQQKSSENDGKGNSAQQDATAAPTAGVKKAKKYVQDLPKDAVQTTHQLQDGDVIVLATDGFWDNVFTKEAIELVDRELGDIIRDQQLLHSTTHRLSSSGEIVETMSADEILARVRALSKRLTNTARRFSLDAKRMTPFSQGARHIQSGGKVDDITVIVTLVRSTTAQL
ncbi:protein serine/threonine phosphatase 2C [Linnemannia elongata AG-77]|uniref:Protein phosphatase n=1 Tax=Linnemannia elongata AG-77 TaxID=1314771 RepID=A0A197JVP4_9FUNG|nr:protein serine/threonine phosphatase 2C [Linnemannia elongata AG-77]